MYTTKPKFKYCKNRYNEQKRFFIRQERESGDYIIISLYYTPFTTKVVQQFFAGTCVYYVYKGSYHQVSNSKYITIYLALPFSYVTLHFVVPEKLGFLVSMLFDAKLTLTILASDPVLPLSYKGIYILLYQCPNLS